MDCESLFTLIFIISFFFGIVAVSIIYSNAVFFSRLTTGVDAIQDNLAALRNCKLDTLDAGFKGKGIDHDHK